LPTNPTSQQQTPSDRVVVKLRFNQDYETFMREGKIGPTLSGLAKALNIAPAEISLLSIRSGCTFVVVALPRATAQWLINEGIATDAEGITPEEAEQLNAMDTAVEGDQIGRPYLRRHRSVDLEVNLSWLHLSDLHIKDDYADPGSDTNADLQRFVRDLPGCLEEAEIEPDAIFFTGDVADKASSKEYEAANLFFSDVKKCLRGSSRNAPFLVIPGNHDVSWTDIDVDKEKQIRKRPAEGEKYEENARNFHDYISKRHENYAAFSAAFNEAAFEWSDGCVFAESFPAGTPQVKVGVAGLNSAWLSSRKEVLEDSSVDVSRPHFDLQHLVIGTKQIRKAKSVLSDAQVKIALVHHQPFSQWYHEENHQLQRQELTFFDFILRGHQHEPEARQGVRFAGQGDYVELAPGALRTWPHYFQGFMAVELDFTAGLMRMTAWNVSHPSRDWVRDQGFGDGGVDYLLLPRRLRSRLRKLAAKVS
jgi:3',5'-cyclic AMP phosphodiesterase CpdA